MPVRTRAVLVGLSAVVWFPTFVTVINTLIRRHEALGPEIAFGVVLGAYSGWRYWKRRR